MTLYVEKLVLHNFRGVKYGEVELAPLTVLVGPNNSGKTTILEALLLAHGFRPLFGNYTVEQLLADMHRTLGSASLDHLIFGYGVRTRKAFVWYRRPDGKSIAIVISVNTSFLHFYLLENIDTKTLIDSDNEALAKHGLRRIASIARFGTHGSYFRNPVIADVLTVRPNIIHLFQKFIYDVWSDIVNSGISSSIAEWISEITGEKYLDILAEPFGGQPTLYLYRSDKSRIRLGDIGDGIKLLATVRIVVEYLNPNMILWDDVECHLNPRALTLLAMWLTELVEKGKQVIVATHSLEAVKTIARVASMVTDTTVVKLRLDEGNLIVQKLSVDDVEKLEELGIDVRV